MRDLYHKGLKKIAHFQVEHPFITVLLIGLLTVAIFGGVPLVKTVASLEQMMPKSVEEVKAFNTLRDNGMGQDIIAVILEVDRDSTNPNGIIDVRDERVYSYLKETTAFLASEADALSVHSYAEFIDYYVQKTNASYESIWQHDLAKESLSDFVNNDATLTLILIKTDVSADDTRMNLLSEKIKQDIVSSGVPKGLRVTYTGTPVIQQRLGELIGSDRSSTQWISTLFVFLLVAITFGTFTSAIVPIIVVTTSVNWLYGTMGFTNLPISTLAGGVAAMVIGIGIDFAIHIMSKFKYERKKGHTLKTSIEMAVVETGTALTATSLTTIAAFLAFLTGVMPEMGRFGILMAIGITYSLIFSLFGLPAVLVIEEKILERFFRKAHFGVEGEYHATKNGQQRMVLKEGKND